MHELGVVFQAIKIVEEVAKENNLTEIEKCNCGNWRSFNSYRIISSELLEVVCRKEIRHYA